MSVRDGSGLSGFSYVVDNDAYLGRHARRERVETGPALPIRVPMLGLLRPSELLTRDEGDDETGEVDPLPNSAVDRS
jgi:hypothetical protein